MDFFEQNNSENDEKVEEKREEAFGPTDGSVCPSGEVAESYSAEEYARYKAKRRFNRTPLVLALFGLIFSVFYGAGIIPGIIALVMAAQRYRVHKSEPLKWAIIVSITCIAVSAAFISALFGATLAAIVKQVTDESSIAFVGN